MLLIACWPVTVAVMLFGDPFGQLPTLPTALGGFAPTPTVLTAAAFGGGIAVWASRQKADRLAAGVILCTAVLATAWSQQVSWAAGAALLFYATAEEVAFRGAASVALVVIVLRFAARRRRLPGSGALVAVLLMPAFSFLLLPGHLDQLAGLNVTMTVVTAAAFVAAHLLYVLLVWRFGLFLTACAAHAISNLWIFTALSEPAVMAGRLASFLLVFAAIALSERMATFERIKTADGDRQRDLPSAANRMAVPAG